MINGKIGIGIVGAGNIAALHARVIKDLPQAELIGIYDVKKSAAEAMAANFGCQAFSDYSEFLSVSEMDAVTIATPSGLHGTMAIPAAKAGKHVFCEKPLDITLEKADDIIKTCIEILFRYLGIFYIQSIFSIDIGYLTTIRLTFCS